MGQIINTAQQLLETYTTRCLFHVFLCVFSFSRVAAHSNKNLMAASNLGVVFGPTLMKSREESMAAIMNLKYQSIVIELLIKEFDAVSTKQLQL